MRATTNVSLAGSQSEPHRVRRLPAANKENASPPGCMRVSRESRPGAKAVCHQAARLHTSNCRGSFRRLPTRTTSLCFDSQTMVLKTRSCGRVRTQKNNGAQANGSPTCAVQKRVAGAAQRHRGGRTRVSDPLRGSSVKIGTISGVPHRKVLACSSQCQQKPAVGERQSCKLKALGSIPSAASTEKISMAPQGQG